MQFHITEQMIDASFEAMKAEALKDGHDWGEVERADAKNTQRMREVIRAMLIAAANVVTRKST